jgi:hypothetical protein
LKIILYFIATHIRIILLRVQLKITINLCKLFPFLQAIKFFTEDYPAGRRSESKQIEASPSESTGRDGREQCSEPQSHSAQEDDVFEAASLSNSVHDDADLAAKTSEVGPATTESLPVDKTTAEDSLAQNVGDSVGDQETVTAAQSVMLKNLWNSLSVRCQVSSTLVATVPVP